MSDHQPGFDRAGRTELALLLVSVLIAALILAIPKNPTSAASSRFILTTTVLGAIGMGGFALIRLAQRYRHHRLMSRYVGASRSIDDTLAYIGHEALLARRGLMIGLVVAYAAAVGAVLTRWPQCAALSAMHAPLKWLSGVCVCLLVLRPFLVRKHIANKLYLHRCLRQQAAHIGFRPGHRTVASVRDNASEDSFVAGGFRWRLDDLYKNLVVFGITGSGKTVTVLNPILESLLRVKQNGLLAAILIFDPKGAYRDVIEGLCARAGRLDDLLILSPDEWATKAGEPGAIFWNPVDTPEEPVEVAARLSIVAKAAGGLKEGNSFFPDAARIFMRHAFTLCRAAKAPDPASIIDLHRLCGEPADNAVEFQQLLDVLEDLFPEPMPPEIDTAIQYFKTEWFSLPDKQRAGVRSTINQVTDDFTASPFDEMLSGPSTFRIADMIDQGKIFYVHLPLSQRERLSKIICTFIKLEFQREILRRVKKERPSFLFADEFQTLFTSGNEKNDSDFFERSRESNHGNVIATQNLSSFLKKSGNRPDVMNFLGLCAVKIFLRNDERETNEWASNLYGERGEVVVTMSETAQIGGWFSKNHTSYSRSTKALRVVPPEAFTSLPIPERGDPSRQFAGSIVHLGSRGTSQKLTLNWPVYPLQP